MAFDLASHGIATAGEVMELPWLLVYRMYVMLSNREKDKQRKERRRRRQQQHRMASRPRRSIR